MTYALINQPPPSEIQTKTWIKTELVECSTKPIESIDLRELYYLAKVANILDVEFNDKETLVSRLQSIQNNDGGFGFENSDTYTTLLVVSILSGFDAHPLDKKVAYCGYKNVKLMMEDSYSEGANIPATTQISIPHICRLFHWKILIQNRKMLKDF